MKLEQVNLREKLTVRLFDRRGRTIRSAVRKINRIMRCHVTKRRHRIHWRLISRLYRISRHFKGRTIKIYSGYRHPRVAGRRTSRHVTGRAVDFRVEGVSKQRLRDYLLATYKHAGIGYYPGAPFVHLDVRKKRAFWVDLSGTGEEPRYVGDSYAYVRRERSGRPAMNESERLAEARRAIARIIAEARRAGGEASVRLPVTAGTDSPGAPSKSDARAMVGSEANSKRSAPGISAPGESSAPPKRREIASEAPSTARTSSRPAALAGSAAASPSGHEDAAKPGKRRGRAETPDRGAPAITPTPGPPPVGPVPQEVTTVRKKERAATPTLRRAPVSNLRGAP
jgi:uncharacterized protein YcbK (DUF882 family)